MSLIVLMLLVFLINLPFGYWRGKVNKFSKEWIMAVHVPVPFVFLLRIISGFGWKFIPLFMLSFAAGQLAGGKLGK